MTNIVKPRFGIDIDGTVTSPATLIPHINKAYNLSLTLDDIVEYDFLSGFPHPVDRLQFNNWFKENEPVMYAVSEEADHAKDILNAWQQNYELYYISARANNVFDITKNWFTERNIPFDHIELLGTDKKVKTAKQYGVELFFEDKHDTAVSIAEELKIPVILFDTPYNRLTIPNNVIRVNNWLEANDWVKRHF